MNVSHMHAHYKKKLIHTNHDMVGIVGIKAINTLNVTVESDSCFHGYSNISQ